MAFHCRLRRDFRAFRLDRMVKTEPLEETFIRNEDFDYRAYAIQYLESYPVRWRLDILFQADREAVLRRIPATYGELSEEPAGVRLLWPIDDLDYAARYLMAQRLPFVIRNPPELRDALRTLAAEALRIADGSGG